MTNGGACLFLSATGSQRPTLDQLFNTFLVRLRADLNSTLLSATKLFLGITLHYYAQLFRLSYPACHKE